MRSGCSILCQSAFRSRGLSKMMNHGKERSVEGSLSRAGAEAPAGGESAGARGALAWAKSRGPMPMIRYLKRSKAQNLLELHNLAGPAAAVSRSRDADPRIAQRE